MTEPNFVDNDDLMSVLQWIGTTLEKNNDVLMSILAHHDSDTAEFVDYAHNTKYVFLNEQSEEQVSRLYEEFQQRNEEKNESAIESDN